MVVENPVSTSMVLLFARRSLRPEACISVTLGETARAMGTGTKEEQSRVDGPACVVF